MLIEIIVAGFFFHIKEITYKQMTVFPKLMTCCVKSIRFRLSFDLNRAGMKHLLLKGTEKERNKETPCPIDNWYTRILWY